MFTTHHTTVCRECGMERSCPYTQQSMSQNQNTYNTHAPLIPVYSRKKRFERLLNSIITPCPFAGDNKMLEYLWPHRPMENTKSLISLIKKSPIKDKRYASMHLYTSLFVKDYSAPVPPKNIAFLKRKMLRCFQDLEFAHRRCLPNGPFFNYMWILSKYLQEHKLHDYIPHVKPLKCKHRRIVYEKMYKLVLKSLNTCGQV